MPLRKCTRFRSIEKINKDLRMAIATFEGYPQLAKEKRTKNKERNRDNTKV